MFLRIFILIFIFCASALAENVDEDSLDSKTLDPAEWNSDSLAEDRIKLQKMSIEEIEGNHPEVKKNYLVLAKVEALKDLSKNKICITEDSLIDFRAAPNSALLKVDLYEKNNIARIFSKALKYLIRKNENEEIKELYKKVEEAELEEDIKKLIFELEKLATFEKIDYENKEYNKVYNDVLLAIMDVLERFDTDLYKNKKRIFDKSHSLVRFFINMDKALKLISVKYMTEQTISKIRANLENRLNSITGQTKLGATLSVPVASNVNVDIEAVVSTDSFGSSSISFFTSSNSAKVQVGSTVNFLMTKLGVSAGIEKVSTNIFYSLEQVMDDFASDPSLHDQFHLSFLNEATKKRSDMQDVEKDLLKKMGELDGMLKIFGALPQVVNLNWLDITKSKFIDKSKETIGIGELKASLPALADLGISLKSEYSHKTYTKFASQLSVLKEDCLPIDGLDIEALEEIIGAKYNLARPQKNPKFKKNNKKEPEFIALMPDAGMLLGHLRSYVKVIEEINNPSPDSDMKELKNKKHMYEDLLSPKQKLFSREGRSGVLKSCMLTAAALRSEDKEEEHTSIYKNIYFELTRLLKLQAFSTNSENSKISSTKNTIASNVDCSINKLSAKVSFPIPVVGDLSVNMTRQVVKDSPIEDENGKYMIMNFSLPLASVGVIGMPSTQRKLAKIFHKASKSEKIKLDLRDFLLVGEAFKLITSKSLGSTSKLVVMGQGINLGVNLSWTGSSQFEFTWRYIEDDLYDVTPLPGHDVIFREGGYWTLINSSISTSFDVLTAFGQVEKNIGTNSYYDFISRYNALRLGFEDSGTQVNTAYEVLKNDQYKKLLLVFRNSAKKDSDALFELQKIYNKILENIPDKDISIIKECTEIFDKFLNSCKKLDAICISEAESKENLESKENSEDESDEYEAAEVNEDAEVDDDNEKQKEEILDYDYDSNQNISVLSEEGGRQMDESLKYLYKILELNYRYSYKIHYDKSYENADKH